MNINSLGYCINIPRLPTLKPRSVGAVLNQKQLNELKQLDIKAADKNALVNMNELKIPIDEEYYFKLSDYFDFVRNPYMFRVGDVGVKVNFGNGKRFSDSIMDVVTNPDEFL